MKCLCQFQLDHYQLKNIRVETNEEFDDTIKTHTGDIKTQFNIAPHSHDKLRYRLTLDVSIQPTVQKEKVFFPYLVSVIGYGFFSFKEEYDNDKINEALSFHGLSILYGLIRAQVAQITAQSVHGQFLLPVLNLATGSLNE